MTKDEPISAKAQQGVVKRSVCIAGHRTSISLEKEFWDELKKIADLKKTSLSLLVAQTDQNRTGNLSSALRLLVLAHLKNFIHTQRNERFSPNKEGRD